jgi:nicotinamide phosphoribosyltransferase
MNPLLLVDSYKIHHTNMYPEGMTKLYSNFTPRKSRMKGVDKVVVFGIQHFILEYLIKQFNEEFFGKRVGTGAHSLSSTVPFWKMIEEYERHCNVDTKHIKELWKLGYLPIEIKALEEGTLCPIGVPMMTITNTHPDFGWLVNYLETLISCMLWQPVTSATIAYEYKKILDKYALETTGSKEGVQWQGHDFSMRGMSSVESATLSGMGHLTSFTGTDTIPAIYQLESSYKAQGLIGDSVPATEHSVMCMGTKESEIDTFKRLLNLYPTGILSVVSDTWDLWKVCTEYLPQLKSEILARDGKLVIRPDSGDPVDIICGVGLNNKTMSFKEYDAQGKPEYKGVIELLWDTFGGTINEQGYKVLDPHIGAIYGDSITLERAIEICERLKAKGFASTNIVLGIGSFTYQYNTRDTFGFAMKATYGEITHPPVKGGSFETDSYVEAREIFKDPITDDGTKKSKKGLLRVIEGMGVNHPNPFVDSIGVEDQCTWEQEQTGLLTTVFKDGKLVKETTLDEIRNRLNGK